MIPLIKPDIQFDDVCDDIRDIIESGRLTSGPYVSRFERDFAEFININNALSTTSATTALHLSMVAKGLGPGDEVLVSDFSFPATGNAIVQVGAIPVFIDTKPGKFDADIKDARNKVTPKTKAIIVVHPFGQPAEMDEVKELSTENNLWILEDAACAFGATYKGVPCGKLGDAACFSFHPRKVLTTGEGGMITTNDDLLFERLLILHAHGAKSINDAQSFIMNGYNYRMSEIQAALGIIQLQRFESIIKKRKLIAEFYMEELKGVEDISIPLSSSFENCTFQSFVILLNENIDRNNIVKQMREKGIETTLGTYAMHAHPAFNKFGYTRGDLPNSYSAECQSLTLPLFNGMKLEDVKFIVDALKKSIL